MLYVNQTHKNTYIYSLTPTSKLQPERENSHIEVAK